MADFIDCYNREWPMGRPGSMIPADVRESFIQKAV